ncbi:MAG: NAD(P)H-hydrate dehydratase, partial [Anaerolineae bacterium]|nr:NAD(P)H-hydrate dehydratase [Anaerolineae bacterium]
LLANIHHHLAALPTPPTIIAVDCPSGIDCDTGQAAPQCLPADLTVCMAAVKTGMLRFPAFELLGDLRLVDIGLPADLAPWQAIRRRVVAADMLRGVLPPRPALAHKGTFGTALVVAGSLSYTGAALLAGRAAFRVGAGLVTLAVAQPLHAALAGHFPEATWLLLPHEAGFISAQAHTVVRSHLQHAAALLLGPGFGLASTTADFLSTLLESQVTLPTVIDADGLKLLARIPHWPQKLPTASVLTPHPGEMAVLTGLPVAEIQADRLEIAEKYAADWGHVVVLKGANTVIAAPDGSAAVIPVASPALARAGSGDVLAGLVAGLCAQGVPAYPAAYTAAWLHAQSGLAAARRLGPASVLAGDLITELPGVLLSMD